MLRLTTNGAHNERIMRKMQNKTGY